MVYIRGHANDYDRWELEGVKNWSYKHCLPYFKKAHCHQAGPDVYRGGEGPLYVSHGTQHDQPLFETFIQAGVQAGYPYTSDMNGYQQEGFGPMDMTIFKGQRWSTSNAYLRPIKHRKNLTIQTNSLVHRILFQGKTAVGVKVATRNKNETSIIYFEKEVILCGGSINSPQLLMLSGLGDADHLKALDIPVVQHLPGVGNNLQDHLDLYVQYKCKKPITLHNATWKYPHKMVGIGLQWLWNQTGKGASAHLESRGFIRSKAGVSHPDIQYHFLPGSLTEQLIPGSCHAMHAHCSPMRASSVGTIRLKSKNPKDYPLIDPNYLSTEQDIVDIRAAVRLTREIFEQKAFDQYRSDAIEPPADIVSDDQIDAWVRQHTESAYHPACTNKMGEDPMAVVDSFTKVHALEGLRVVDASIMPSMLSGNLNAPTIMIAEKAADLILGRTPLPVADAPVYQAKDWKPQQR
jgi:choline dehydrogenase